MHYDVTFIPEVGQSLFTCKATGSIQAGALRQQILTDHSNLVVDKTMVLPSRAWMKMVGRGAWLSFVYLCGYLVLNLLYLNMR